MVACLSASLTGLMIAPARAQTEASTSARQAYDDSMQRMHTDMMQGIAHDDPDVAFAAGMLAHHEGAVEMARIELAHGKDPVLRQLAQDVITAQEAEIGLLRQWLATNAPQTGAATPAPAAAHAH
ncbi:DUF305 domain-containing protein [Corticibacter populi]|uniref:DUF305 domain-containing protein n=2 Tax=Corticibacter populi TaxID=1550736 RepID=A0A3M6QWF8_9BURK|nr:DUF305 domain-containing protein [Corticibacter populi]